jgi:hypothetical protein
MYHGRVVVVVVAASEVLSLLVPMMLVLLLRAPTAATTFESMIVDGGIPVDVAGIGMTPLRLSPPLPIVLEL